ncbi:MAG TPA: zinc ribbon domain-containing protein [Candidatus Acidoferrum sp.]|nr:zinc ribbon domain-containing protein [Candidatus Acidoferrum sp.]
MRKCKCGNDVANNAKFCPKCGYRFTGCLTKSLAWFFGIAIAFGLLIAIISNIGDGPNKPPVSPIPRPTPAASYVLPTKIELDARAERGPDGETFITGSTNLPDGIKLGIDILVGQKLGGQDYDVIVRNGQFRSAGFTKGEQPWPAGNYRVRILSIFNEAWQTPEVLSIVGKGGKNLHGKLFKATDPDVVDSDKELEEVRTISFPSFGLDPEAKAVHLVKTAILTVPGLGKSATNIQKNIALFMESPGVAPQPGKGWSATRGSGNSYAVTFDFLDGGKPAQAIWSVDLDTGTVKYVNKSAKLFSWTPKD